MALLLRARANVIYMQSRLSEKPADMASANTSNLLISLCLSLPFALVSWTEAGIKRRRVSLFRIKEALST